MATSGIDGQLDQGGEIAGVVTDAGTGEPIVGIDVCAYKGQSGFSNFGGCQLTSATGAYAISGLREAEYRLAFLPPGGSGSNYITQYYDGSAAYASATFVPLRHDERRGSINAQEGGGPPSPCVGALSPLTGGSPDGSWNLYVLDDDSTASSASPSTTGR